MDGRIELHCGDCVEVLATFADCLIDSCVTDPPYGIGFMGRGWDHGVPDVGYWGEVYRVLKPGAHLLAFGGTRTYHRMACAIEDAGFEIRDCVQWLYGSGFPKSHDVSKGIDRAAGAEREVVGRYLPPDGKERPNSFRSTGDVYGEHGGPFQTLVTAPATDAARQWEGWGTALKPACELIVLARKPLSEGTVAANVLKWGTGAINVDGCRVEGAPRTTHVDGDHRQKLTSKGTNGGAWANQDANLGPCSEVYAAREGRWPANVIHDGSEEVVAAFPESAGQQGAVLGTEPSECHNGVYSGPRKREGIEYQPRGDSGSAARFFYTAKADSDDRLGSKHPTVKPLDLMQYLVRLITPRGGLVLDPFAGTGTTGEAAWREGMRAVLIEREEEYLADIRRRMALLLAGPDERVRESVKARKLARDDGPLFAAR